MAVSPIERALAARLREREAEAFAAEVQRRITRITADLASLMTLVEQHVKESRSG